jgi:DNA-binding MarR family transcriptional regulator
MQQLQNASDSRVCAAAVLEAVLEVMVTLREKTARRLHGPTLVQMRALGALRKRPGATLSWLSDQLALTLSATSRLADNLVARKLIERRIPPGNRRSVSLYLTAAGTKAMQVKMGEARRELAKSLKTLKPRERSQLSAAMVRLHILLEADAQRNE